MDFPVLREGILKVIPQRDPFLFVDEIVSANTETLEAVYTFRPDNPVFAGHFPGNPVVPGVLMLEALAQAGAYFLLSKPENAGKGVYLLKVNNAKFKRIVRPGERIELRIEKGRVFMGTAECRAEARVNGESAAAAELMCALAQQASPDTGCV
ncbi:3-hydroxyacyl-[acyl-carrier-protein] dehydratase FabZ [Clostridia bacterium]|nr:3-hydroxyacyl-[acyl-carrier-protein] dehydratase FabZ [Clostridia bacterium]